MDTITRYCKQCRQHQSQRQFSKTQWKKVVQQERRCRSCIDANQQGERDNKLERKRMHEQRVGEQLQQKKQGEHDNKQKRKRMHEQRGEQQKKSRRRLISSLQTKRFDHVRLLTLIATLPLSANVCMVIYEFSSDGFEFENKDWVAMRRIAPGAQCKLCKVYSSEVRFGPAQWRNRTRITGINCLQCAPPPAHSHSSRDIRSSSSSSSSIRTM